MNGEQTLTSIKKMQLHISGGTHHHSHGEGSHSSKRLERIVTVRAVSGLSGDMLLTGLACLAGVDAEAMDALSETIGLPALKGCTRLEPRSVHAIVGWGCKIALPHEHAHRTLADILLLLEQSALTDRAKTLARKTFTSLAEAEGRVHQRPAEEVHFHEVGALDSILDICMVCALFDQLNPDRFVCSPLPMGDGGVQCAHGWIPTPAPAVLELLEGVSVCGFAGQGETVTPTAIALLRTLGAQFGPWPSMVVERRALVYGDRIFENAPNGAVFAMGRGLPAVSS